MKPNRVTLITLGARDVAKARDYYVALGWEIEADMGHTVFFGMDGMKFGLFSLEGLAAETGRQIETLQTGAQTLAQNFNDPAEVDEMFARAVAAGAEPVRAPFKTDWGGYSSYVAAPDGHLWEFAHNPFWSLDDDGRIV